MFPDGIGRGYDTCVLEEVSSTMDAARERAGDLTRPLWVLAKRQTGARGRRGRAWRMPEGNFAATLALPLDRPAPEAALRSFTAALALDDALTAITGRPAALSLKWPNDVLLNGGKVAGILLESTAKGHLTGLLMIGVGINLAAAPDASEVEEGAVRPVSLVGETGHLVPPEEALTLLGDAFAAREDTLTSEGFAPIRSAWLARAARLGQTIHARTGTETLTGRFEGIDVTGALCLATEEGLITLPAADIHFAKPEIPNASLR
ncbi:biotin--[acetyl-CoA-carboxylase] ligase [Tropicimonas sp. IMCC34011]|uniref:biotin--[acetyl-CoA-carboxylase] ligase n=1 Tax=Tropicimonas sp. IMCC34011 TaxID=2248759 RepID=UPI002101C438|nr:biotin--[acetyl-CoA-carboxylase] ligase [Tropicimonas sp. IMCC34011]